MVAASLCWYNLNVRSSDDASSLENVEDVFECRKDEDIDQYVWKENF